MKRKLICLILAMFLCGVAAAQDVSVRDDYPDEYIVVEGDTLWDISGRFLDHPWQWPAIWQANQQIENPHLIYPGDKVSLVYIDGQPRLMVDRGRPTVRLSPETRVTTRQPIPPIRREWIEGLIRNFRMVNSQEAYDALPYVVANEETRRQAAVQDKTYVRGLDGSVGEFYAVMRLGSIYYRKDGEIRRAVDPGYNLHAPVSEEWHGTLTDRVLNLSPQNYGDIVGFELYQVAEGMLSKTGDPAIVTIGSAQEPVTEGDVVLPLTDEGYVAEYQPRAMDVVPEGMRVLGVQGDNKLVGHLKMVSISGGSRQGVEPGHVFSAFRPGVEIRDRVKYPAGSLADAGTWKGDKVTLPDEFDAHIMVFRVFDEVSYALIMEGDRPVREADILKHPDETL
ncbi:MAG: LysM peptidoglycan-binding domain-containing protein [Xanthomonadales bacterium]|nr:LysM peptidoglycan-binding domain-containing protein [Xanthomonadales bacterium]